MKPLYLIIGILMIHFIIQSDRQPSSMQSVRVINNGQDTLSINNLMIAPGEHIDLPSRKITISSDYMPNLQETITVFPVEAFIKAGLFFDPIKKSYFIRIERSSNVVNDLLPSIHPRDPIPQAL